MTSPTPPTEFSGFIHAADGGLLDGRGNPVLLRGFGLGNWMVPEGYMWRFEEPGPMSPRQIEAFFEDLLGPDRARKFWRGFHDRYVTADDIGRMAAIGVNHVRLPINARLIFAEDGTPIEEGGLELIDRLIDWCRPYGLWVILALHGAPGGQTGTGIDDSFGTPALFEDVRNRELTVELWRCIARRYRDEPVIAGYDLLNEPLPDEYQHTYANDLVWLYKELTSAIREVDPNHLIIYEGLHRATDWSIFTEVWDPNSMLQFHRYWSPPDRVGIQDFLDVRERLGLPIYMGEGGENNNDWIQTAFTLYDEHSISWNFWPWKKIRTTTSPCSVEPPPGWDAVLEYASARGPRPDPDEAWAIFSELLVRCDLARCTWRPEVLSALLRQAPVHFPAWGFGFQGPGVSYQTSAATPLPGFRADDQVTLHAHGSPEGWPGFDHNDGADRAEGDEIVVELREADWIAYDFVLDRPRSLTVVVAYSSPDEPPEVLVDGSRLPATVEHGRLAAVTGTPLPAGTHRIHVISTTDATRLAWLEATPT